MLKDKRYDALKKYIESGAIQSFTEIFDIIPKSTIVKDTCINFVRLNNKINYPEKFTVKDLLTIARLLALTAGNCMTLLVNKFLFFCYQQLFFMASSLRRNHFIGIPFLGFY